MEVTMRFFEQLWETPERVTISSFLATLCGGAAIDLTIENVLDIDNLWEKAVISSAAVGVFAAIVTAILEILQYNYHPTNAQSENPDNCKRVVMGTEIFSTLSAFLSGLFATWLVEQSGSSKLEQNDSFWLPFSISAGRTIARSIGFFAARKIITKCCQVVPDGPTQGTPLNRE
jgi:hypothetical protein